MKALKWTIIAIVVGGIFALLLRRNPVRQIIKEFEALDAEAKAKRKIERLGHDLAKRTILKQYEDRIATLDIKHKKRVAELRDDPVGLSRWITRLSDD